MATKKFTTAQMQNLSIALAHQFMGNAIAFGNRYGYNMNEFYCGKIKHIRENQRVVFTDTNRVGNKTFGNALKKTTCFQVIDCGWNEFYAIVTINVSKIMEFANGNEVIQNALQIVQMQNQK